MQFICIFLAQRIGKRSVMGFQIYRSNQPIRSGNNTDITDINRSDPMIGTTLETAKCLCNAYREQASAFFFHTKLEQVSHLVLRLAWRPLGNGAAGTARIHLQCLRRWTSLTHSTAWTDRHSMSSVVTTPQVFLGGLSGVTHSPLNSTLALRPYHQREGFNKVTLLAQCSLHQPFSLFC